MRSLTSNPPGFTLVELLAGTAIFAIIMALLLSILNSFEATTDIKVTQQRMAEVADKAGEYYLSRENLPVPTATATVPAPMGEVPLTAFHLDSKYRIDSWGRPFHYFTARNDGANGRPGQILIDPLAAGAPGGAPVAMVIIPQADFTVTPLVEGKTLLRGVMANNRPVAGVLISSGPNNVPEYNNDNPPAPNAYPVPFVLDAGSDDIILVIDLTSQATQIAQTELKKLGEKVRAFDDRYIGKDNDNNGRYDEDGRDVDIPPDGIQESCVSELYPANDPEIDRVDGVLDNPDPCSGGNIDAFPSYYLPVRLTAGGDINDLDDYSCGVPTLDDMKANYWGNNPPLGYYYPRIEFQGRTVTSTVIVNPNPPPATIPGPLSYGPWIHCPARDLPRDYYRVPMNIGASAAQDCHWGLVGDPNVDPNELTNDQARAALFCAYGLSPANIVDPWLNGYVWGCGQGSGQTGNSCTNEYPDTDSRFHKFYSAGPNGIIDPQPFQGDDIVAPL